MSNPSGSSPRNNSAVAADASSAAGVSGVPSGAPPGTLSSAVLGTANAAAAAAAALDARLNNLRLLKRPTLCGAREHFTGEMDDDYMPQQLLYDYSTWDAW